VSSLVLLIECEQFSSKFFSHCWPHCCTYRVINNRRRKVICSWGLEAGTGECTYFSVGEWTFEQIACQLSLKKAPSIVWKDEDERERDAWVVDIPTVIPVLCFSRNSNNMRCISRHKVMSAVILVIWVLFLLDLTEWLPSKCFCRVFSGMA